MADSTSHGFCRGEGVCRVCCLRIQKTNEAVPEERDIQPQTLIIRNKGNQGWWFFGSSLKYHFFDVNEVASLRELLAKDSEDTCTVMCESTDIDVNTSTVRR